MKLWVSKELYGRAQACADAAGMEFCEWARRVFRSLEAGKIQPYLVTSHHHELARCQDGTCATLPGVFDSLEPQEARAAIVQAVEHCENRMPRLDPEAIAGEIEVKRQEAALTRRLAELAAVGAGA